MAFIGRNNNGYSRGGIDVESTVNLFFKGVLLFPIFLMAAYIGLAMMKHMIFHGIPGMNAPTEQQQQRLREKDARIGLEPEKTEVSSVTTSEESNWIPANTQVARDIRRLNENRRDEAWLKEHQEYVKEQQELLTLKEDNNRMRNQIALEESSKPSQETLLAQAKTEAKTSCLRNVSGQFQGREGSFEHIQARHNCEYFKF